MLKWTVTRKPTSSETDRSRPLLTDDRSNRRRDVVTDGTPIKCRRSSTSRRRSAVRKSISPNIKRSSLEFDDKENCFTSTPIKSSENHYQCNPLRDVSNLTPKDTNNRRIRSAKRCRERHNEKRGSCGESNSARRAPLSEKKKKKKACSNRSHDRHFPFSPTGIGDCFSTNYFKPFESVDSHIEGLPATENACGCKNEPSSTKKVLKFERGGFDYFAPTLPTFDVEDSPCFQRTDRDFRDLNRKSCPSSFGFPLVTVSRYKANEDGYPPSKKSKIEEEGLNLVPFRGPDSNNIESEFCTPDRVNVSPLVKRLIDLRFSNVSCKTVQNRIAKTTTKHNDSSYINDLSLDKIVDAILETTNENDNSDTKEINSSGNTSMVVNLDPRLQERENELNETHEENLINSEHERQISASTGSFDSGFSSTTTKQSHEIGDNFTCKCNNNKDALKRCEEMKVRCDKTIIDLNSTFNERCVDANFKGRKRSCLSLTQHEIKPKRSCSDRSRESFTLRRQKCVRRRKTNCGSLQKPELKMTNSALSAENSKAISNKIEDVEFAASFESSNISGILCNADENSFRCDESSRECKTNLEQTYTVKNESEVFQRRTRRCLSFETSTTDDKLAASGNASTSNEENIEIKGSMDLELSYLRGQLVLKVFRCKDLNRLGIEGQVNAYVKVILTDRIGDVRKKRNGVLQRTAVQANSSRPTFNHTFRLPIHKQDINKRIHIEVWHRDRIYRRSEFLGCMSFTIKNVIKKDISGSYRLLPQSTGRCQNVPITKQQNLAQSFASTAIEIDYHTEEPIIINMCDSQTTNEEVMSIDDFDGEFKKTSNPALLNQHQKDADENLFLRYLELDPTEGPDAIPAALQRKATGNKNGRTPFTTTKKLIRAPKSGFGFSVVWTHPPRIERVEKGLPADKAGILPGDYIIFVDKHNIVTMPEIEILNLIKSFGSQITLEIFRRNASRNGSMLSVRPVQIASGLPTASCTTQHRPSTIGSINTSAECSRRRLHLPQVTFSAEKPITNPEEGRKKAMYQLLAKEQHYSAALQFAVTRFVSALAERRDLITPAEHRTLFQNSEEILRITEDILDSIVPEDGDPQIHLLPKVYQSKVNEITSAYKRYCSGIKKADCILVNKTRNSNSDFVRFLQTPAIPRRRPDITAFIHKPLEHYREVLKLFNVLLSTIKANQEDYPVISKIVQDLQITYREMTAEAGLMEPPVGEGRPLLSVQDLENRLVFTKCRPFVLSKPGRQWIFGGDLSRVEGRNVRQYWTLLFSDLILFAKVSRDRVLFIVEDPLPLAHITDLLFNVRKKATEFRIIVQPGGTPAKSPTIHCGPDLTRTPRKNANKRCVVLRAPTTELKAVWQNLLQRQTFHVISGMDGSSFSSPLESPDAPITSSVATLQSAESLSIRRQNPQCVNQSETTETQKQIAEIIENKCKQLGKCSSSSKGNAIHLEQWMKGQFGTGQSQTPEEEPECEVWTEEMLRRRTEELQLVDNRTSPRHNNENRCEELILSDQSPSKSTSPESQVTVRSSPIAPESVPVCKQCHKTCLTSSNSTNTNVNNSNNNIDHSNCSINESLRNSKTRPSSATNFHEVIEKEENADEDDFGRIMLMGLSAVNPAASLVKLDPFSPVPKISVVPPTPDTRSEFRYSETVCSRRLQILQINNNELYKDVDSPDDSPQDEEQPYHSLSSSNPTLRRFGTVSSLERLGSEETDDNNDVNATSSDSGDDEIGIDNQAFNHSTIRGWTARAGAFVSEKMAFFEKLGEDYRTGTGFFERYLKATEVKGENGDDDDCENSGATSGEEIWGTPTSGEMEDPLSPNYDGRRSPNGDSVSSDNGDDTELMMDELLMTPPIASANLRGLLPRRTLEPLMEEDSDTCTSSSSTPTEQTPSPKQGNGTGDVADTCWTAAEVPRKGTTPELSSIPVPASPASSTAKTPRILRSDSYRHIIEAEDDNANFFNRFKSNAKIINVERIPRSRGVKLFEIFYVKKNERKIHETFPEGGHLIKLFNREGVSSDEVPTSYSQKPLSPRKPKDKQMDGRFWRQLSRRRGNKKSNQPA